MAHVMGIIAFGAASLYTENACSIQQKRDLYEEVRKMPPAAESVRKQAVKKPEISAKWKKGSCSLLDQNTIVYSANKKRYEMRLLAPAYQGNEKPLDISCSEKRTVVLTTKKIVTIPGCDSLREGATDIETSLRQDLGKAAAKGIASGKVDGNNVYIITRNNELWYTDLNDPENILGYRIDSMNSGTKKMGVHKSILFIVQNAPARDNFLLAVTMQGEEIVLKKFAYVHESSGRISIYERGDHLELRIGEDTHLVNVREPGNVSSISVRPGN